LQSELALKGNEEIELPPAEDIYYLNGKLIDTELAERFKSLEQEQKQLADTKAAKERIAYIADFGMQCGDSDMGSQGGKVRLE